MEAPGAARLRPDLGSATRSEPRLSQPAPGRPVVPTRLRPRSFVWFRPRRGGAVTGLKPWCVGADRTRMRPAPRPRVMALVWSLVVLVLSVSIASAMERPPPPLETSTRVRATGTDALAL